MYIYWRLKDTDHSDMVLRISDNGEEHVHLGNRGWVKTGISPSYLFDYGDRYGEYEVISAEEAIKRTRPS